MNLRTKVLKNDVYQVIKDMWSKLLFNSGFVRK